MKEQAPVRYAIGIDIGGTKIAAGLVRFPQGTMLARRLIPTEPKQGGAAILQRIVALVSVLVTEAASQNLKIVGIGLGICELVDHQGAILSANCVSLKTEQIQMALGAFGPATVEADVRAAALAEARYGAGRTARIFLFVTIGTGISSCLVIEGKPYTGARGATGTIASSPMPYHRGNCESLTLEQFAAGPGLVQRFRKTGEAAESAREVLAAAEAGHPEAIRIVESAATALGTTIGHLVNTLDPEVVILGGGLGLAEGRYREILIRAAREHIWWEGHRDLPIIPALAGSDAGIIGAAAMIV